MLKCAKCDVPLPPENDYIVCYGCKSGFHYVCANVRKAKWRTNTMEVKTSWRCFCCKDKTSGMPILSANAKKEVQMQDSTKQQFESSDVFLNKMVNILRTDIRQIIKEENAEFATKMNEFQQSIEFYSHQLDDFLKKVSALTEENKQIKKDYYELKVKYSELEKTTNNLVIKTEGDKQYSRNHNIIVNGIPETRNENLVDIAKALRKYIDAQIDKTDLQTIHRLTTHTKDNNKPIIIQFSNRMVRHNYLSKAKSRKPKLNNIFPDCAANPIYVNEHLTTFYKKLMQEAKSRVVNGQKTYKYVWFKNSKLLIRKTDNSQIVKVRCMDIV